MKVKYLTVYVLYITWSYFGSVFGISDPPSVTIDSTSELLFRGILNYNHTSNVKHKFYCLLTEHGIKGTIKWFQVKGNVHKYVNAKQSYETHLTEMDHNTTIYCMFSYRSECDIPTEVLSNKIELNSELRPTMKYTKQNVEMNVNVKVEQIQPKNETEINTFYVTCDLSRKDNNIETLEIYKIIGNVSTWVNSTDSSIATATIRTSDNHTKVYCRAVTGENPETFYSSNYAPMFIYNQVNFSDYRSAITDQCDVPSDTKSNKVIEIAVPCSLVGILLIAVIFFAWKRCRMRANRRKEPEVQYAEIQVPEHSNGDLPKRDETPYAKIVGVIYPANNNNKPRTNTKPKQVPVEESPYAVPYVNNYNLAIK